MVIIGIASVRTYVSVNSEPKKLNDISSELNEEGTRIIDYGIYTKDDINRVLKNFTDSEFAPYFLKKTESTNVVFIYGNSTDLYSVQYNPSYTGSVSATIGGVSPTWISETIIPNRTKVDTSTGSVTVEVLDRSFEFQIRENQMFYFIVTQEENEERYFEKND
jgi:hypothetical protein